MKKTKKRSKKGFTLIELLAVIVILAVVMAVTVPTVIGSMNKSKEKAFNSSVKEVQKYIDKQVGNCKMKNQLVTSYDETIFSDIDSCTINSDQSNKILELVGYENELIDMSIQDNIILTVKGKGIYKSYSYLFVEEPDLSTGLVPIIYNKDHWEIADTSQKWYDYAKQEWANAASLKSTVKKIPGTELDIENDAYAMFVWIPRYSYTIGCKGQNANINLTSSQCLGYKIDGASDLSTSTPGAIDIKFVSKSTKEKYDGYDGNVSGKSPTYYYSDDNRTPSNWYTHPAFWWDKNGNNIWDEDENLSGIWVGKFETSGRASAPTILPNVKSLRSQTISSQFTTAQKFTAKDNAYGLTGDAHMMKNSEWGAVAYLAQSIYGKYANPNYKGANKEIYINNSSSMYTGRSYGATKTSNVSTSAGTYKYDGESTSSTGTKNVLAGTGASTTGNIYGIYDMSGGAVEYVMGNYNNGTQQVTGNSGFEKISNPWPDEKYFDKYTYSSNLFTEKDSTTNGAALAETKNWYSDNSPTDYGSTSPWLVRGSSHGGSSGAGPFCGHTLAGGRVLSYSFRVSLVSSS